MDWWGGVGEGRHVFHILKDISLHVPEQTFCVWVMALLLTGLIRAASKEN